MQETLLAIIVKLYVWELQTFEFNTNLISLLTYMD